MSVVQADVPSLMDSEAVALRQPSLPLPPTQLTKDLQQQQDTDVGPRLDMQLGPQEMPVISLTCRSVTLALTNINHLRLGLYWYCDGLMQCSCCKRAKSFCQRKCVGSNDMFAV